MVGPPIVMLAYLWNVLSESYAVPVRTAHFCDARPAHGLFSCVSTSTVLVILASVRSHAALLALLSSRTRPSAIGFQKKNPESQAVSAPTSPSRGA
eukprot:6455738-Amphidinium_carterae.4